MIERTINMALALAIANSCGLADKHEEAASKCWCHKVFYTFSDFACILEHCSIRQILRLRQVNRWFYRTCTIDVVWQRYNVTNMRNIYLHFDMTLSRLSAQEQRICRSASRLYDRSEFGLVTRTGFPVKISENESLDFEKLHSYVKLLIVTSPFLYSEFFRELSDPRVVKCASGYAGLAIYMSDSLKCNRDISLWVAKWDPLAATCLGRYLQEREFQIAFVQANKGQAFYLSPEMLDPSIVRLFLAGEGYFWMVTLIPPREFQVFKRLYPDFATLGFVRLLYKRDKVSLSRVNEYYPEMMSSLEIIIKWVTCAGPTAFCSLPSQIKELPHVLSACFAVPKDHYFYQAWFDQPSQALKGFIDSLADPEYAKKIVRIEPHILPAALALHNDSVGQELRELAQDFDEGKCPWPFNEKLRYYRLGWMQNSSWLPLGTDPDAIDLQHIMERCYGPDYG